MTARSETIMVTVLGLLNNLALTGANALRDDPSIVEVFPSIRIDQGADNVIPDRAIFPKVARDLTIKITAHVKNNSAPVTELNTIREQVYAAMTADHTLGLVYVNDTMSLGDDEPEITNESDKITGRLEMNFSVKYTHAWSDLGA